MNSGEEDLSESSILSSHFNAIHRYENYLKGVYATYPVAVSDKGPYNPSKVFINLALVKAPKVSRAEADEFTRLTLQGDIDQIMFAKEQIEMDDILKAEDKTRLVLVEGAPGIGKSTLAWELCRQWESLQSLKHFDLIVLLRLREEGVQKAADISDLFYHNDGSLSEHVGKEVKEREGEGVLFVFDGFDEFPMELYKQSLVMKIICGQYYLPRATVIVTSRPSATAHLYKLLRTNIDKRIEVVGFSDKEIYEYAESNLDITPGSNIVADFIDYLSVNPAIKGLMYNPLNCAIVVEVYRETHELKKPIPHTQTQLYTELILYRLSRYLSAQGDPFSQKLPDTLEDINYDDTLYSSLWRLWDWLINGNPYPKKIRDQLFYLGELAFKGRVNEEVIFKELPQGCSTLGLLMKYSSLYGRKENVTFTFLHLTLQEYLGAFYISQLSEDMQKAYFINYSHLKHMNVVWRFVAGLTKMRNVGWDIFKGWTATWLEGSDFYTYDYIMDGNVVLVQPFIIQCLYEAQDVQSCDNIFDSLSVKYPERVFNPYQGLTNYDVFALGYCVSLCENVWNISLKLTDLDLDMLGHGMNAVNSGGGYVENLDLWGSKVTIRREENLLRMPDSIVGKIKSLNLRGCNITDTEIDILADSLPYFHKLISLNISYNPLSTGSSVKLLQALQMHGILEELHYRGLVIGMDEVVALSDLIHSSNSLKRLAIGESYTRNITFPPEVLKHLMKAVLASSSVEILYIRTNPSTSPLNHIETISDSITTLQFTSFYESSSFLDEDNTSHEQLTIKGGKKLSYILRRNLSLKELWLEIALDNDELNDIIQSLEENHTLKRLVLYRRRHSQYLSQTEHELDSRIIISEF